MRRADAPSLQLVTHDQVNEKKGTFLDATVRMVSYLYLLASRTVPSKSSQSAGSAALARLEAKDGRGGSASRPHRAGGGVGSRPGALEEVRRKPQPEMGEPVPMEVHTTT